MNVNYLGTVNTCLAFLTYMIRQKSGNIVNISSSGGFIGVFGYCAYSASKFAIVGFSEAFRQEILEHNIKVTVVYPPDTDTPMFHEELKYRPGETNDIAGKVVPMKAEKVALLMLKGVSKNKFIVIPGFMNKFFYYFNRLFPSLIRKYIDSIIRNYRKKKNG
jgi:3-dehydrosphinganine reductase